MSDQIVLTPEGKLKLEEELKNLKEVRRPEIIEKIEQAKELGDLSENAEYHDAKDQQGMIEARILEIEEIFKKAVITTGQEKATGKIQIGSSFVVEDSKGNQKELTLVGFNEADPANGRISNESPTGRAFIDKKQGDEVEVEAPRGIIKYKILEIK
ncbi:MAG: transcription elongation factor GreA [Candidatus Falkowbacteria bacterium]